MNLDKGFALKLTHPLGDGIASPGSHVSQLWNDKGGSRSCRPVVLAETIIQVEKQSA